MKVVASVVQAYPEPTLRREISLQNVTGLHPARGKGLRAKTDRHEPLPQTARQRPPPRPACGPPLTRRTGPPHRHLSQVPETNLHERVCVCVGGGVSVCVGCLRIFPLLSGKALNPMSALSWPEMKLRVWPALLLYEGNGTERWTLDLS